MLHTQHLAVCAKLGQSLVCILLITWVTSDNILLCQVGFSGNISLAHDALLCSVNSYKTGKRAPASLPLQLFYTLPVCFKSPNARLAWKYSETVAFPSISFLTACVRSGKAAREMRSSALRLFWGALPPCLLQIVCPYILHLRHSRLRSLNCALHFLGSRESMRQFYHDSA